MAPYGSYSGLIFLAENFIVIPNTQTNALRLEIWDIPSLSTHQTPRPACILQLPELSPGNSLHYITCRGEPNPIGSGSQFESDKPFYQSSHEAIMLFQIDIQLLGDPVAHQLQHGDGMRHAFTLFVHWHRNLKALCEVYERQCVEMNSKSGDSFTGIPASDDESENEGDVLIRATDNNFTTMPWSSWGPSLVPS